MASNLPPGVTNRMIEDACDPGGCPVCMRHADDCVCPECPVCGETGRLSCYEVVDSVHGKHLEPTREQVLSRQRAIIYVAMQRVQDESYALHELESNPDFDPSDYFYSQAKEA